jgi:NADH:ubiquinone reductase (H+-translocating)
MAEQPRVVIVGAGFGGLWAARALARSRADILLLDRHNYHNFFPLLYQVAAAELEPEDIIYPVRSILRGKKQVRLVVDKVTGVDIDQKLVKTINRSFPYDYLILSLGSRPRFFGIEGAAQFALPLRTIEDAIAVRNHILLQFEQALYETDVEKRRRLLTFAVIGGGATGVEFAGALAELIWGPLKKDYSSLDYHEVRFILLEASDHLLPGVHEKLQEYSLKRLRNMGVEVRLGAIVTKVTSESVALQDGTVLPLETAIWTAGVGGAPPPGQEGLPILKNGQVSVLPTLQVKEHPEVYITGDLAYVEQDGHPIPMVATLAMQEGQMAAKNILRQIQGLEPLPFHYFDFGVAVAIGRNAAAVDLFGYLFTGFLAWVLWVGINIYRLIGFRNRLLVLVNWAWDYLFFERGVRLIVTVPEERRQSS